MDEPDRPSLAAGKNNASLCGVPDACFSACLPTYQHVFGSCTSGVVIVCILFSFLSTSVFFNSVCELEFRFRRWNMA